MSRRAGHRHQVASTGLVDVAGEEVPLSLGGECGELHCPHRPLGDLERGLVTCRHERGPVEVVDEAGLRNLIEGHESETS